MYDVLPLETSQPSEWDCLQKLMRHVLCTSMHKLLTSWQMTCSHLMTATTLMLIVSCSLVTWLELILYGSAINVLWLLISWLELSHSSSKLQLLLADQLKDLFICQYNVTCSCHASVCMYLEIKSGNILLPIFHCQLMFDSVVHWSAAVCRRPKNIGILHLIVLGYIGEWVG